MVRSGVERQGERTRIESLNAKHLHTTAYDPDGLRCPTIDPRRLERLIGLGVGDVWTRLVERKLREKLRTAFQGAGFVRPKISIEAAAGNPGILTVAVVTERCWLVRVWQRERKAVVFVTHDIDEAISLGDRVVVMTGRPGTLAEEFHTAGSQWLDPARRDDADFARIRQRIWLLVRDEARKSLGLSA